MPPPKRPGLKQNLVAKVIFFYQTAKKNGEKVTFCWWICDVGGVFWAKKQVFTLYMGDFGKSLRILSKSLRNLSKSLRNLCKSFAGGVKSSG